MGAFIKKQFGFTEEGTKEVEVFATESELQSITGEEGKLYLTKDTSKLFYWDTVTTTFKESSQTVVTTEVIYFDLETDLLAATGEEGKLYLAKDTKKLYFWDVVHGAMIESGTAHSTEYSNGGTINGNLYVEGNLFGKGRTIFSAGTAHDPNEIEGVLRIVSDGPDANTGIFLSYFPPEATNTNNNTANKLSITGKFAGPLDEFKVVAKKATLLDGEYDREIIHSGNIGNYMDGSSGTGGSSSKTVQKATVPANGSAVVTVPEDSIFTATREEAKALNKSTDTTQAWADSSMGTSTPNKAFDTSTGTYWQSDTPGPDSIGASWIAYSFGTAQTIDSLYILHYNSSTALDSFMLQGSNDGGATWIDIEEVTGVYYNGHEHQLSSTASYGHYRLLATSTSTYRWAIKTLELRKSATLQHRIKDADSIDIYTEGDQMTIENNSSVEKTVKVVAQ
ncbi:hypothetical protein FZC84_21310 [Rossellomorea vietnamensis]|uniref:F5/8 type C domain-containing protein n=1 Tax=Rossellomorea vietnamensis TaxID=218284 RepID=A0A5D4M363_9BACI|nr:discoidin domain-containing protein [Rossellomorea vietnamensis]TYR95733.1 hypothetical protein FZC84_21310 [Rossellomorea vietnamensis]